MTFNEFATAHSIALTSRPRHFPEPAFSVKGGTNWTCTLAREGRELEIPYSMGSAYSPQPRGYVGGVRLMTKQQLPKLEDVLGCIASDCRSIENARDFDDWCGDFGYTIDSRKAEQMYRTCQDQNQRVRHWLGKVAYEQFLICEEG